MQNFWINKNRERDRFQSRQYWGEINENYAPVELVWDDIYEEEMPILYRNYADLEAVFHIYLTELEHAQGISYKYTERY